ncbi:MAG: hypothetical protein WC365_00615 [Candidatus Babeliales bacterium]|jgi:DNA repair exonuclease SbcCD ATPase subunit
MSILAQLDDAEKTIKAQRQEITGWQQRYEELDTGHSKLFKDFCKMKEENEQWKQKNERQIDMLRRKSEECDKNENKYEFTRNNWIRAQQEVEQLKLEAHNDGLYNDRVSRLVKANEQLTKQIVASDMMLKEYCRNIVDYLVILAKARKALDTCMEAFEMFVPNKPMEQAKVEIREALAAIDKAGGGQDG